MRLDGRVALISGGGGAMGGAQARLFASEGAAVCVADLFEAKAARVVDEISSHAEGGGGERGGGGGPRGSGRGAGLAGTGPASAGPAGAGPAGARPAGAGGG